MHEAGGNLETDLQAAVAAAERQTNDAAAAAAASTADSQLGAPPLPPVRPTLYVLVAGKDAAEVAELSVRLLPLHMSWA